MDTFEKMEQDLFNDGITVNRDKLPKCIGFYTKLYDFIYLNVDRDLRGARALSVLSHEVGHYRTGLIGSIGKNEYRADKWAAGNLCDPYDVINALRKGCSNFYELAKELNVDEQFLKRFLAILSDIHGEYYGIGNYVLYFNPLFVKNRSTGQVWPEVWV